VLGENLVELVFGFQNAFCANLNVGRLTLHAAQRLVNHDLRVRKREPLALRTAREKHGAHGSGHAHADCRDITRDMLHRVVDREASRHRSARGVDVELDVFGLVLAFQEKESGPR
jgi:hypothetical protein